MSIWGICARMGESASRATVSRFERFVSDFYCSSAVWIEPLYIEKDTSTL